MTRRTSALLGCATTAALALSLGAVRTVVYAGSTPLSLASAQVTLEGTSNLHPYSASTTTVRVTRLVAPAAPGEVIDTVLKPGGIDAFEIAIAAASLKSPKDGLDKNMHKALKVQEHPEITFRLGSIAPSGENLRATGVLTVAGVQREVAIDLEARRAGERVTVTGVTDLLMTDFGITPPKAMLGMLKTDPKVRVRFEIVLAAAQA